MLVHTCLECDTVSINRIAADDDPERILAVFHSSLDVSQHGEEAYVRGEGALLILRDALPEKAPAPLTAAAVSLGAAGSRS